MSTVTLGDGAPNEIVAVLADGSIFRLAVDAKITGGTGAAVDVASWIGSTAPSVGQKAMAASLPVVIASNQTTLPVAIATSSTGGPTSVGASAVDVLILAANASRKGASIRNNGTQNLYLLCSTTTATFANAQAVLTPQGYFEVPFGYTGQIRGLWDVAVGGENAAIVEFT